MEKECEELNSVFRMSEDSLQLHSFEMHYHSLAVLYHHSLAVFRKGKWGRGLLSFCECGVMVIVISVAVHVLHM